MNISPLQPQDIYLKLALENGPMSLVKKGHIPLAQTKGQTDEELLKACRDFESIFINQLFKEMRKTIPKDGLIPTSQEEELFTGMFDEEVSKMISNSGRMGLADMLYQQLRDKSLENKGNFNGENINGRKYYQVNGSD